MKVVLPTVAVVLVGLIVVWPQLKVDESQFKIGFARLKATEAGDPSLVNARFVGSDKQDRPFSVTADLAKHMLDEKSMVELEMPKADIISDDGSWLVLTASTGIFDRNAKTLDLDGEVNLFHDSGFEFTTEAAHIDLRGGVAESNTPVRGQGPFGTLRSEGFRMEERGNRILFTGKSRMVIYPSAEKAVK
jgi:lipopolysaccharide export system protein LptC